MDKMQKTSVKLLLCFIIIITGCFLQSRTVRANEVGSDMMFDLWKYRTGEVNTGLLTGKPTKPGPAEPAAITASISGKVFCRERGTLLPQDEVEIQLLDVSRQDAPTTVIARQNISQTGQVPIPFKLSYDPVKINPAHTYVVQARILRNGQVQFVNEVPCYVITHGHPNTVEVLLTKTETTAVNEKGPSHDSDVSAFMGTYKRTFTGAGGTVDETLDIRSNETVEFNSIGTKGVVKKAGVWSPEGKQLAVTLTQKNGEYINPERIVFGLKGNTLEAVEFDRNAYGPQYKFIRITVPGYKK